MTDLMEFISQLSEEHVLELLERYRSMGPFLGIFITFMKSFIPPLPTIVIVGANAAAYGLWPGFLYSWIGITSGCIVSFLIIRKLAGHRLIERMRERPKVKKGMLWIRNNAFSYVFVLSILPVGPFVVVNLVAGIAKMPIRSYMLAIALGKALMVFIVSFFGHDIVRMIQNPEQLIYIGLFIAISIWISKKIEAKFIKNETKPL